MTLKTFSISALLVSLMFLSLFGCGSDEDVTSKAPKSEHDFSKADLVGSWSVVSINDGSPLGFIHAYETAEVDPDKDDTVISTGNPDVSDESDAHAIDIDTFHFDFATDDLWTLNARFETTLMLTVEDEQPPSPGEGEGEEAVSNGGYMLSGKVEIIGTWSGTYSILEGSVLSLIRKEKDLKITPINEGAFEKDLSHKEVAVRNGLHKKFREHILTPFSKTHITLEEKTLNLASTGSARSKMVLEKQ